MSSSQVVRIGNGDTIQIKTGTIQGIGPQGPSGPTGSVGGDGPPGQQGEKGEIGHVDESVTYANESTPFQSVAPTTNTTINVPTTVMDEFTARQSLSGFSFPAGTYNVFAMVSFNRSTGTPSGYRTVRILVNSDVVWEQTVPAITTTPTTSVCIAAGLRIVNPADVVSIQVYHSDSVSVTVPKASLWVSRIGAGMIGPAGEVGAAGPVGATGGSGPAGPSGSLGDNTTSFDDIES